MTSPAPAPPSLNPLARLHTRSLHWTVSGQMARRILLLPVALATFSATRPSREARMTGYAVAGRRRLTGDPLLRRRRGRQGSALDVRHRRFGNRHSRRSACRASRGARVGTGNAEHRRPGGHGLGPPGLGRADPRDAVRP